MRFLGALLSWVDLAPAVVAVFMRGVCLSLCLSSNCYCNASGLGSIGNTLAPAPAVAITWVSAGTRPGEAVFVGVPVLAFYPSRLQLTAALTCPSTGSRTALPLLQGGYSNSSSAMFALPQTGTPALEQWQLQLCTGVHGQTTCTPPTYIFEPNLMWYTCESSAGAVDCAPGSMLRVFGRQLSYHGADCRRHNSTQPAAPGLELQLRLTPAASSAVNTRGGKITGGSGSVVIKAEAESCHSASFTLPGPDVLVPGSAYRIELANVVGGHRGAFTVPKETDVQTLRLQRQTPRGAKVFSPSARTLAAVMSALSAAAANPGGGVVQLEAGVYSFAAPDTLVVGDGVTLQGMGRSQTTLQWARQTPSTGTIRKHLGMIHGANTTHGWTLQDLSVIAPQQDWMSSYMASPVISDCAATGTWTDGSFHPPETHGLYDEVWACSGMTVTNVGITIDKYCAAGTAWPASHSQIINQNGANIWI